MTDVYSIRDVIIVIVERRGAKFADYKVAVRERFLEESVYSPCECLLSYCLHWSLTYPIAPTNKGVDPIGMAAVPSCRSCGA